MGDVEVSSALKRFSLAAKRRNLGKASGSKLAESLVKSWTELLEKSQAVFEDADDVVVAFNGFFQILGDALLAVSNLGNDHYGWLELAEPCFAAATHAGEFVDCILSTATTSKLVPSATCKRIKEVVVLFLERIQVVYDHLLWYAEDAEWLDWGCTGALRLNMVRILFVASGFDQASRGLLGAGGLLELVGNDVQTGVSVMGFVLWSDDAPYDLQVVAAKCLSNLTTADAAFLGALNSGGASGAVWEDPKADIKHLTNVLNGHVNSLIQAIIDHQVVDSFIACVNRHQKTPHKLGPVVRALLTTLHNCLLYCSENQKRLRMHLATHAELVPTVLIPYVEQTLLPAIDARSASCPAGAFEWRCLEASLQTFIVVTFNVGILRERFRNSNLIPRVLATCKASEMTGRVSWIELLVKLCVNIDANLNNWKDAASEILSFAEALPSESRARLRRRLAKGGSGPLPVMRNPGAAVSLFASLLGQAVPTVAAAAPAAAAQNASSTCKTKQGKHKKRGKRRGKKDGWVAKQFGMQMDLDADRHVTAEGVTAEDTPVNAVSGSEEEDASESEQLEQAEVTTAAGKSTFGGDGLLLQDGPVVEDSLTCALSGTLLQDPVQTPAGHTYNRSTLEDWVAQHGPTDPVAGTPLDLAACRNAPELQEAACAAQLGELSREAMARLCDEAAVETPQHGSSLSGAHCSDSAKGPLLGELPSLQRPARKARARGAIRVRSRAAISGEIPEQLRCAIDGKVMTDPLRSPYGHAFERRSLERWILTCGSICPISARPLRLEDCCDDTVLRQQVAGFLREKRLQVRGENGDGWQPVCAEVGNSDACA